MHFLNHSFIHDLLLHAHVQPYWIPVYTWVAAACPCSTKLNSRLTLYQVDNVKGGPTSGYCKHNAN
jgi:hypothetical protein